MKDSLDLMSLLSHKKNLSRRIHLPGIIDLIFQSSLSSFSASQVSSDDDGEQVIFIQIKNCLLCCRICWFVDWLTSPVCRYQHRFAMDQRVSKNAVINSQWIVNDWNFYLLESRLLKTVTGWNPTEIWHVVLFAGARKTKLMIIALLHEHGWRTYRWA